MLQLVAIVYSVSCRSTCSCLMVKCVLAAAAGGKCSLQTPSMSNTIPWLHSLPYTPSSRALRRERAAALLLLPAAKRKGSLFCPATVPQPPCSRLPDVGPPLASLKASAETLDIVS
jgi:hypothetical protein